MLFLFVFVFVINYYYMENFGKLGFCFIWVVFQFGGLFRILFQFLLLLGQREVIVRYFQMNDQGSRDIEKGYFFRYLIGLYVFKVRINVRKISECVLKYIFLMKKCERKYLFNMLCVVVLYVLICIILFINFNNVVSQIFYFIL